MPLSISPTVAIPDDALELRFIRASGPGGQNVNKVASAVQLRFNAAGCDALAPNVKARLTTLAGRRMSDEGVLVITAQRFRTQEQNKRDALERLTQLLQQALVTPKIRRATKPTRASKQRRLEHKQQHARTKRLRGKPLVSD
jgi:ribosome-associated protein